MSREEGELCLQAGSRQPSLAERLQGPTTVDIKGEKAQSGYGSAAV